MPKVILLINNAITRQAAKDVRPKGWQLSENEFRGHPMVPRRYSLTATDYFRSSMARYYSWRTGAGPNQYSDFGYLLSSAEKGFDGQASAINAIAFNIANSSDFVSEIRDFEPSDLNQVRWYLLFNPVPALSRLLGAPLEDPNPFPITAPQLGYEFQQLEIVGDENQWLLSSEANNITNAFQFLDSNGQYLNWQAFVMGDAALTFDGPARKFPGIIGVGMINKMFYDHAFERPQVPVVTEASYRYYNQFFDTLRSNPYASELDVPNFYSVCSILSAPNGSLAYPGLYRNYYPPEGVDLSSINYVKDILSKVAAPVHDPNNNTDILSPGGNLTIGQVMATSEVPDSLLSRFTRLSFSSVTAPAREEFRKINEHVGLPYKIMAGTAESPATLMNGRQNLFPYSIKIQFGDWLLDNSGSATSDLLENLPEPCGTNRRTEIMSNFFLYEIMRANIADFRYYPDAEGWALYAQTLQGSNAYENLHFSAVVTDTESVENPISYYGFDWTNPGSTTNTWETSPQSREPYSLRAINLTNLLKNIAQYQFDPNSDQSSYARPAASTPSDAYGHQGYNGFIGQSQAKNVAAGRGLIIGESFNDDVVDGQSIPTALDSAGDPIVGAMEASLSHLGMDTLDFLDFQLEIASFLTEKMRTLGAVLGGEKATKDTLAYKLEKYVVGANGQIGDTPIQSIYFANAAGPKSYVDTQVFFRKKYKYKLYAYDLVVGNQYKYTDPEVFPPIESKWPNPLGHMWAKMYPSGSWSARPNINLRVANPETNQRTLTWNPVGPEHDSWSASSGPYNKHKLRIEGVGSTHSNNLLAEGAIIDVEYAMFADTTMGTENMHQSTALHSSAQITLSNPTAQIGYLNAAAFASSLESVINNQVRNYFATHDPLNNTSEGRYNSEVRVRIIEHTYGDLDSNGQPIANITRLYIAQVKSLRGSARGFTEDKETLWQSIHDYGDVQTQSDSIKRDLTGRSTPFHLDPDSSLSAAESTGHQWNNSGRHEPLIQYRRGGAFAPRPTDTEYYGTNNQYVHPDWDPDDYLNRWEIYWDLSLENNPSAQLTAPIDLSLDLRTGQHGYEPQIPWDTANAGTANVSVFNYKCPKIIEVPIGETGIIQVADLPPQFPDVEIFPLKGSNRNIKILLNSNFTKGSYNPIEILPEDAQIFDDIRDSQGRSVGEPLVFSSDDRLTSYQVFKTTTAPQTYQDFAGHLLLTKEGITDSGHRVESVSILDNIDPNVYYYYCFRSIDQNGFISNPSPILKVQMVDDNGRIYPIIEPYTFDLRDRRSTKKTFKRYIEIDASLQEKMITSNDTSSAGTPYQAPMGVSMGSAAGTFGPGTEFKVRIISKDTGRKIDLNLNFNVETIPNPNLPGN